MLGQKLHLKFSGHVQKEDYIEYTILIKDSTGDTWHTSQRYKYLRQIYRELRDKFGKDKLPRFPPKKLIGNTKENFILQRRAALEIFFNNVLNLYNLNDMEPLQRFLQKPKRASTTSPNQPVQPVQRPSNNTQQQQSQQQIASPNSVNKVDKNKERDRERIIQRLKDQFFNLNDRFDPLGEEESQKRTNVYKLNFKFEGPAEKQYNLPKGTESNLLNIYDESLVSQNKQITSRAIRALDKIHEGIKNIKFSGIDDIVVIH